MVGNTTLVPYGIQNEESDLRIHVCPVAKHVYVFPTKHGVQAIDTGKFEKKPGYQDIHGCNGKTAEGYLVPPSSIEGCISIRIPVFILVRYPIYQWDSTTDKGNKATAIVADLLRLGRIPLKADPEVIHDSDLQIKGTDITVKLNTRIQVKCDFAGGDKRHGHVTGNLFLQVAECNPLRRT